MAYILDIVIVNFLGCDDGIVVMRESALILMRCSKVFSGKIKMSSSFKRFHKKQVQQMCKMLTIDEAT